MRVSGGIGRRLAYLLIPSWIGTASFPFMSCRSSTGLTGWLQHWRSAQASKHVVWGCEDTADRPLVSSRLCQPEPYLFPAGEEATGCLRGFGPRDAMVLMREGA